MRTRSIVTASLLSLSAFIPRAAEASLDGAGSIMYIPVVAQTASYTSQITVRNPYSYTLAIAVYYTGGSGTSAAGLRTCTALGVPANSTVQFSAASQCSLPSGSQYGLLSLVETEAIPSPFQAYSRTQTPGGNGFSVPAYPAGAIEAPTYGHFVLGLKRQAAAPVYQTNCFVASTDDPTNYQILLHDASGNQIGNTISNSLTSYQLVRYLDIFNAAGLPPGDYSNVAAEFRADPNPTAALLSFCTVQESTFFGADFRIAQPVQPMDGFRQRAEVVNTAHSYVPDAFTMTRYELGLRQPDRVRCELTSASVSFLEMRVLMPEGTPVVGGNNVTDTGVFYTGNRSVNGGFSDNWHIDVSPREGYLGPFPVFFEITCSADNGMYINTIPLELPDAF